MCSGLFGHSHETFNYVGRRRGLVTSAPPPTMSGVDIGRVQEAATAIAIDVAITVSVIATTKVSMDSNKNSLSQYYSLYWIRRK